MAVKIITPVTEEPVTLAEAKAHLRVDDPVDAGALAAENAWISQCISAAREEAEQVLDRCVAPQTLQLLLDDFPAGEILLPRPPVTTIDWVRYIDPNGVEQTLSGALYSLDDAGIDHWLLPAYGSGWPATRDQANAMRVQYIAGWPRSLCPAAIKSWILLRVGTLYQHREADSERPPMPAQFVDRLVDRYRIPAL